MTISVSSSYPTQSAYGGFNIRCLQSAFGRFRNYARAYTPADTTKQIGGKAYKVHLNGYDQTAMLTKGGKSTRNEIWYFTEATLAAARINDFKYVLISAPAGFFGGKTKLDWPRLYNLRLDPFERMSMLPGESLFAAKGYRSSISRSARSISAISPDVNFPIFFRSLSFEKAWMWLVLR